MARANLDVDACLRPIFSTNPGEFLMSSKAQKLRALIESGEHFVCGDTYSALTGRIVEHVGFPAAYLGGHACSAFHYAVPDNGVYSQVEQIEQASRIANVIDIPLIADADTLGETVADAYHFTRRYIQQGIAGFHVEDERNPKHSKYVNGLWSIEDQQARIDAAARARRRSDRKSRLPPWASPFRARPSTWRPAAGSSRR